MPSDTTSRSLGPNIIEIPAVLVLDGQDETVAPDSQITNPVRIPVRIEFPAGGPTGIPQALPDGGPPAPQGTR
jgi:hypothetical protein